MISVNLNIISFPIEPRQMIIMFLQILKILCYGVFLVHEDGQEGTAETSSGNKKKKKKKKKKTGSCNY